MGVRLVPRSVTSDAAADIPACIQSFVQDLPPKQGCQVHPCAHPNWNASSQKGLSPTGVYSESPEGTFLLHAGWFHAVAGCLVVRHSLS